MTLTMPLMDEYTLIGGPFDGTRINTSGTRVVQMPIQRPLEVFRKVVPFRPEPFMGTATYTRFGRIYWWDGLIGDAHCDMDVSDEIVADAGPKIRAVIRDEMRRHLQDLDPTKELGRIVWRVIPATGQWRSTIRAFVGPRAAEIALDVRSKRRGIPGG